MNIFWRTTIHSLTVCKALKIDQVNNIQKTKTMASGPITSWEIDGETVEKSLQMVTAVMKLKDACSFEEKL